MHKESDRAGYLPLPCSLFTEQPFFRSFFVRMRRRISTYLLARNELQTATMPKLLRNGQDERHDLLDRR